MGGPDRPEVEVHLASLGKWLNFSGPLCPQRQMGGPQGWLLRGLRGDAHSRGRGWLGARDEPEVPVVVSSGEAGRP